MVLIAFVCGAVVAEFQVSPIYDFFGHAFSAASAWKIKTFEYNQARDTDLWIKTCYADTGVVKWNKEIAFNGYTFLTSSHAQKAFLMDMEGRIVHEWSVPFRKAWPTPSHLGRLVADSFIAWRKAVLMPNGDVIVVVIGQGAAPWGYGLMRIDKDSNVLWTFSDNTHHDVTVGSDGNLYTLVHHVSNLPVPEIPEINQPYFRDYIVVLSPDGKEIRRIDLFNSLLKYFNSTGQSEMLYSFIYRRNGDFLHTNTAKYIPKPFADQVPGLEEGQILVSFRSMSMLASVDPECGDVVWSIQGPWKGQHDPDMLPNGHFLIFDNNGRRMLGGGSAIIEYDPVGKRIQWLYSGQSEDFLSNIRGVQQKLPNGNVLITESQGGRILEVNQNKELVWEWISPYRSAPDGNYTAVVMAASRHAPDELTFLKDN